MSEKVAILGASAKPDRYAYKALRMLQEYGHQPLPIHPELKEVEGVHVFKDLSELPAGTDTLTIYVNPSISSSIEDKILSTPVKRVIFNPGTENSSLARKLTEKNIEVVEACTLVLLKTGGF